MGKPDRRIDVFIDKHPAWRQELLALRAILLTGPLDEGFKWRQPVYMSGTANIALIGIFKDRCTLSFFKGALLNDDHGLLELPGPNSRAARIINFQNVAQIKAATGALNNYLDQAIQLEKDGAKVDLPKDDLPYPAELTQALADDPDLRAAFDALTPGRQRGYVLTFSQAKQAATRQARIAKARPQILEGKGIHDR